MQIDVLRGGGWLGAGIRVVCGAAEHGEDDGEALGGYRKGDV